MWKSFIDCMVMVMIICLRKYFFCLLSFWLNLVFLVEDGFRNIKCFKLSVDEYWIEVDWCFKGLKLEKIRRIKWKENWIRIFNFFF